MDDCILISVQRLMSGSTVTSDAIFFLINGAVLQNHTQQARAIHHIQETPSTKLDAQGLKARNSYGNKLRKDRKITPRTMRFINWWKGQCYTQCMSREIVRRRNEMTIPIFHSLEMAMRVCAFWGIRRVTLQRGYDMECLLANSFVNDVW